MADEESEIRRMAEIADAINSILDADPVGDTPTDQPTPEKPATQEPVAQEPVAMEAAPEAAAPEPPAPAAEAAPAPVAEAAGDEDPMADIDTSDLDAAIAAELGGDDAAQSSPTDDHFGPVPDMDFAAEPARNDEIGRDVKTGSQMADLSLRMQDTLAEIRAGNIAHTEGRGDLIGQMEEARSEMMGLVREKVAQLNAETMARKTAITEQIEQIDQQSMMFRDELEIMLRQFEDRLQKLQAQYFESSVTDRDRLDRYREFLQYLLSERGL